MYDHLCGDPTAGREPRYDRHASRLAGATEIVQDVIGQCLVKNASVAKALHIDLQTLEFNAGLVGTVLHGDLTEIGLARLRTDTGKLWAANRDGIVSLGIWVVEQFDLRVFCHARAFRNRRLIAFHYIAYARLIARGME